MLDKNIDAEWAWGFRLLPTESELGMASRIPHNHGLIILKCILLIKKLIEKGIWGIIWLTGSVSTKSPKTWAPSNLLLSQFLGWGSYPHELS